MKLILIFIISFTVMAQVNGQGINSFDKQNVNARGKTVTLSGIFLTPFIGAALPLKEFRNNSTTGFDAGVKLEFASTTIFPFVIGGFYEIQTHEGADEFKTTNFLGTYKTKVTSFGGSVDVILNKYIKSNFTTPFVTLEAKVMNVERTITPETNTLNLPLTESVTGFGGGVGFTIFIFDISGVYTFAKEFSSLNIRMRFHIPVIKF